MKTFSSIAYNFLVAYNLQPYYYKTEIEAKEKAFLLNDSDAIYPVYYFTSDTDGKNLLKNFLQKSEKLDNDRFVNLGVVTNYQKKHQQFIIGVKRYRKLI